MFTRTLTTVAALTCAASLALAAQGPVTPTPAAGAPAPAQAQRPAAAVPASPGTPPQLVNVRLDLTITDQRESSTPAPRTVTMLVADRENGRLRAEHPNSNSRLAVDARPEILPNGRIRVSLTMEYRPQGTESDKMQPSLISESVTTVLEDGKQMVVSQSADPTTMHIAVKVEMKATVLR
jgi:hypothetical protein